MSVSEEMVERGGRAIDPAAFEQDEFGNWLQSTDRKIALKASRDCLTAALSDGVVVPSGWQPIETAPKNHLPILVHGRYGTLTAFRDVTWAWWPIPAIDALGYVPTDWQPLPAPPIPASTVEGKNQ